MNAYDLPTAFGPRRHYKKKNLQYKYNYRPTADLDYNIEETFNKCFSFCSTRDTKLPEPDSIFKDNKWKIDHFQELKLALNNTKNKLNDLNLKEWHQHTTNTNIAGDVIKKLKYTVAPEFLTQAWCKMYECLMTFWLVPEELTEGTFNSVHLCEAPGAFITALYHFLQIWYPNAQWNWLATTLNPHHESNPLSQMIQDDRFIMHTLPHWTFGEDGTGNLMDCYNLKHLQGQVKEQLGDNVMLVTADGSIDCQDNPAEQEDCVAPLHFCEAITALSILQPGGSFVLKMFTLLECDSMCLMYLLVCMFSSVYAFKPVKSKEGNSEVYIVCTGYHGQESLSHWMPRLLQHFGPSLDKAMFSENDIPEEFKMQMYDCAKGFTELQIRVIERNLNLFYHPEPEKLLQCRLVKQQVADKYLQYYQLAPVSKVIVGNDVLADTQTINLAPRIEEGTFNDRARQTSPDPVVLLANARAAVGTWPFEEPNCWFLFNTRKRPELKITYGKPVTILNSSKFCHNKVLEALSHVPTASLTSTTTSAVNTTVTVDVGNLPWLWSHTQCNHLLLESISQTTRDLKINTSLCIRGLPLLSQFTVAVVLLLGHSFYQMGLTKKGDVVLCGYKSSWSTMAWLQDVLKKISQLPPDRAIISLLPINVLCDKKFCMDNGVNSFYFCILSINNARLLGSLKAEVLRIQEMEKMQ